MSMSATTEERYTVVRAGTWVWNLPRMLKLSLGLFLIGVGLVAYCAWVAYVSGPEVKNADGEMVPVADISREECNAIKATPVDDDARGTLRIVAVGPAKITLGRHICLVVAGVAANEAIVKLIDARDQAQAKLEEAADGKLAVETAPLEQQLADAIGKIDAAREKTVADSAKGIGLLVYMNDEKSPYKVDARPIDGVQHLRILLDAPVRATDDGAKLWRVLAGNALEGYANDPTKPSVKVFGEVPVTFGLSREAAAAGVPEVAGGAESTIPLYVYSRAPVTAGLWGLAFLVLSFAIFAWYTPILRDNSLTLGMLPSRLEAAKLGLEEANASLVRAQTDLRAARASALTAGTPVDSAKIDAVTAADVRLDQARLRIREVLAMAGVPDADGYFEALKASDTAIAALAAVSAAGTLDAAGTRRISAHKGCKAAEKTLRDLGGLAYNEKASADALAALKANPGDQALKQKDEDAARQLTKAKTLDAALVALVDAMKAADMAERDPSNANVAVAAGKRSDDQWGVVRQAAADAGADATAIETAFGDLKARVTDDHDATAAFNRISGATEGARKAREKINTLEKPAGKASDSFTGFGKAMGSYSLGRTQMAFWLFLVLAGFVYIVMSLGQSDGIINTDVLTLLGISGLTGVGAAILVDDGSETRLSRGFMTDLLSSGEGPQLQRVQAMVWTLVLGGIFVYTVAAHYSMPTFGDLVLLMGLANGLYVGMKLKKGT